VCSAEEKTMDKGKFIFGRELIAIMMSMRLLNRETMKRREKGKSLHCVKSFLIFCFHQHLHEEGKKVSLSIKAFAINYHAGKSLPPSKRTQLLYFLF
jgi:hypothetical protein